MVLKPLKEKFDGTPRSAMSFLVSCAAELDALPADFVEAKKVSFVMMSVAPEHRGLIFPSAPESVVDARRAVARHVLGINSRFDVFKLAHDLPKNKALQRKADETVVQLAGWVTQIAQLVGIAAAAGEQMQQQQAQNFTYSLFEGMLTQAEGGGARLIRVARPDLKDVVEIAKAMMDVGDFTLPVAGQSKAAGPGRTAEVPLVKVAAAAIEKDRASEVAEQVHVLTQKVDRLLLDQRSQMGRLPNPNPTCWRCGHRGHRALEGRKRTCTATKTKDEAPLGADDGWEPLKYRPKNY